MDCLVWQWIEGCTDVPNLHALMWELIAGAGIAFGIWFFQFRKTNTRKMYAEESLLELSGEIRDTVRFFVDELNDPAVDLLELDARIDNVFEKLSNDVQDLVNTSFDVVDNSEIINLRHLKQILNPRIFNKLGIGFFLMIENHTTIILMSLNKQRKELIKKKQKSVNDFIKNNVPADDKKRSDILLAGIKWQILKMSLNPNDPNCISNKSRNM